jgi:hypothetical protein
VQFAEAGRQDGAEPFRVLNGRRMRKMGEYDMFKGIKLAFYRVIDVRVAMPQQIAPPRTNDINVCFAVHAKKPRSFAAVNNHRGQRFVVFHLGTGMPNMPQVAFNPIFTITHRWKEYSTETGFAVGFEA